MPSIFDAIKGDLPKRDAKTIIVKQQPAVQQDDVVSLWQKNNTPQNTQKVLQYLKPTIQSALHSYVPGQEASFRLKATSLALETLKGFDRTKNTSPTTYVFTGLQRLNRIRRERQNPIHIPQSQVYIKQMLDRKTADLQEKLGREPSDQQLSDYTGLSRKKLEKLRDNSIYTVSQSATNDPETGAQRMGDSGISDKDYYDYVYDSVSPVDQKIMQWSSGFGKKTLSNNEIAAKLHLSAGAVSQRKAKIQQMLGQVRGLL